MHCWRSGATPQSALGYMFSFAEGVLALPTMIGLHATLYPELDVGTGVFPSLRYSQTQHAIYGESYLSLVAVPGSRNFLKPIVHVYKLGAILRVCVRMCGSVEMASRSAPTYLAAIFLCIITSVDGMARMPASRNTFSKPPNSQTKEL